MAIISFKKNRREQKRGFTLFELIVVLGIMGVVTTVVLWNNRDFDSSMLLSNLTHDVALSFRQAQVYGISVQKEATSSEYNAGYGIHIDLTKPNQYIFFADKPVGAATVGDRRYRENQDVLLQTYSLQSGYTISRVFRVNPNGSEILLSSAGQTGLVSIVFMRPNPTAYFNYNNSGRSYRGMRIELSSAKGTTRSVLITSTGQISVQNP